MAKWRLLNKGVFARGKDGNVLPLFDDYTGYGCDDERFPEAERRALAALAALEGVADAIRLTGDRRKTTFQSSAIAADQFNQ